MLVAVLFVTAQAVTLRGLRLRIATLEDPPADPPAEPPADPPAEPPKNASKAVEWGSFVSEYCDEFCQMTGVDAGRCTVCAQRMNFSVAEGKTACEVECQGVQTDEVTESVIDCGERLDKCMFDSIEPASCRLECGTSKSKTCSSDCAAFKKSHRKEGELYKTFFGRNYVKVEQQKNVTKVVNGTNTTVEKTVTVKEVKGVEPLPTVGPGGIADGLEKADFRYHTNESAWMVHATDYCSKLYCATPGIDSYHCVECANRLNTSVEHALMSCRVGCDMHHTDQARANELVEPDARCDRLCMTEEFDTATCRLEAEVKVPYGVPPPKELLDKCAAHKQQQRLDGAASGPESMDVVPYFWPSGSNVTHPPPA